MVKCIKNNKIQNLFIFIFIPITVVTTTLGLTLAIPVFIQQNKHHHHLINDYHLQYNNNTNNNYNELEETYNILVIFDFKKILHTISKFNGYYQTIIDILNNKGLILKKDMLLFSLHLNQSLHFWDNDDDDDDDKDVNFCNDHYNNNITEYNYDDDNNTLYVSRERKVCCLLANIFHLEIQALQYYINVFEPQGYNRVLKNITRIKLLYMNQNKLILQYMIANMMDKIMNLLQTIKNGENWTSTFSFYQLISNRLMVEKDMRVSFSNDDKNSRFSNFYQFNRQNGGGKVSKKKNVQRLFVKFIKVPISQ